MGFDFVNELFNNLGFSQYPVFEENLNKYYWSDADYYLYYVDDLKKKGFVVKRNNKGEHKVSRRI